VAEFKGTPGPWTIEEEQRLPFRVSIKAGGFIIAEFHRSHSTDQKTLADCMAAVGFPHGERAEVQQALVRQTADIRAMATAPDMHDLLTGPYWLVWSNEHRAWWGPNNCGYYRVIDAAGRYTLEAALANCQSPSRMGQNPPELVQPAPEWFEKRVAALAKIGGAAHV
jgi:hypothetical protein